MGWGATTVPTAHLCHVGMGSAKPNLSRLPALALQEALSPPGAGVVAVREHRVALGLPHCPLCWGDVRWHWQGWQWWSSRDPGD